MTLLQQQQEKEDTTAAATLMTLPEISVSNQLDWDEADFLPPQSSFAPPIHTTRQIPPIPQQQQQRQREEEQQKEQEKDSSTTTTTGLTRALSLPRLLNKTKELEEQDIRKEVINISTSNPSHLFWVPASQHPEIAPAEFEKYVDAHGLTIRRKSVKRRQSVLSVYFTASDQHQKLLDDLAKSENNSSERDRQTTLDALEYSHKNRMDDGNNTSNNDNEEDRKRKRILRRSVSLHLPTAGDYVRNVPESLVFDRNSSPLDESRALVPKGDRPLLRRGARTKFKRNSSLTASNRPQLVNRKSESDYITNKAAEQQQQHNSIAITRSSSADSDRSGHRGLGITLSDNTAKSFSVDEEEEGVGEEESLLSPVAETEEVRDLCIATRDVLPDNITDMNTEAERSPPAASIVMSRSASTSTATSSSNSRKSTWSWAFWSDEKSSKKNNKIDSVEATPVTNEETQPIDDQSINNRQQQPQASKSSDATLLSSGTNVTTATLAGAVEKGEKGKRFTLSSLFSRKSKNGNNNNLSNYAASMDLYAKETSNTSLTAPKDFQLNRLNITRLPLHVEKAIYKLSHHKLANPKRPLCQQVLISNQMFWYLSVIAQNNPSHASIPSQQPQKKKPRKLIKKQRPPSPQQKKIMMKESSSKLTNIVGGSTFMTTSESSTGFVVPENYLNPKQQQKKATLQKKKPTNGLHDNKHQQHQELNHRHQQLQSSDSSSDDEDENISDQEDEPEEEDDEEEDQKEDDIPLALYKSNATASLRKHGTKSSSEIK